MLEENLLSLGYSKEEIDIIMMKNPNLYRYGFEKMKEKFDYMLEIGYPESYIKGIFINYDSFNIISLYDLKNKIRDLKRLDFTMDDIIYMTYKCPQMFLYDSVYIIDKIQFFVSLGYSYKNVLIMMRKNPNILLSSDEIFKEVIKVFQKYDYTLKDIMLITLNCPFVYSMYVGDIAMKLEFFKQIRMSNYILENPMILVRSIDMIYAKYLYLNSIGLKINKDNFKIIFLGDSEFYKLYKVTREELLNNYENNADKGKLKTLSIRRLMKK